MALPVRVEHDGNEWTIEESGEARVLQERLLKFNPEFHPFLNDSFGTAMNQNVAFTGKATVVHAGVNSGAALTGTTTSTTTDHLIDSGETFSGIAVGMSVKNTTSGNEYALVTVVGSADLTLDNDIFLSGENYEINPIWVGTAVQGTWNFADSSRVSLTSGDNNDEASFDNDTNQQWNTGNGFKAFTGNITLTTFNEVNNIININFDLNGVLVGNAVALNDSIDGGNFTNQAFAIPKADFGIAENDLINGMTISLTRTGGGAKPAFSLDAMQWEEIGASEVFKATTPIGTEFHVTEIRIAIAEDIASTVTNGTMHGLAFNTLMGVTVTNGIVFRRVQSNEVLFAVTIRQLGDFLSTGSNIVNAISDGTNTFITLLVEFPEPIILKGSLDTDFLSFTINDNLSSLLQFTAAARGGLVIPG